MGFPQRLLADDEKLVLVLRRHIKVLFVPIVLLIAVVAVVGASLLIPAQPWASIVIGAIGALILIRWALWPLVVWANTTYAITTRRLVIRTGVLNRSGHDMPLSRLNDVSFSHNLLERMLGCGTLVVESAGEQGQLKLEDVPKVELVQQTLHRLSDDLRGVHGADDVDPGLARSLDDAFDDEYRGPVGSDRSPDERRT
jgi:membrane protein YdbS with pleckstrin-like domain